jgi:hypothetical protein
MAAGSKRSRIKETVGPPSDHHDSLRSKHLKTVIDRNLTRSEAYVEARRSITSGRTPADLNNLGELVALFMQQVKVALSRYQTLHCIMVL